MAMPNTGETRSLILGTRERMIRETGREPSMTDVARAVGCTPENVRVHYRRSGLVTSRQRSPEGRTLCVQKGEAGRHSKEVKAERRAKRDGARAERAAAIIAMRAEGATHREIGRKLGISHGLVWRTLQAHAQL